MTLEEVERRYLEAVLKSYDWNVTVAAHALGISRDTLHRKIKKYNLSPEV